MTAPESESSFYWFVFCWLDFTSHKYKNIERVLEFLFEYCCRILAVVWHLCVFVLEFSFVVEGCLQLFIRSSVV